LGALGGITGTAEARFARAGDHLDRSSLQIYTTNPIETIAGHTVRHSTLHRLRTPVTLYFYHLSPGVVCFACVGQEMIEKNHGKR
jgi:hypothetical protein